jgi:hypothetical protein
MYLALSRRVDRSVRPDVVLGKIRSEVERMILELNQTTDRNIVLLEDKIRALEELLGKADRRIGVLKRELEKHDMSSMVYTNILKRSHPLPGEPQAPDESESASGNEADRADEVRPESGKTARDDTAAPEAGGTTDPAGASAKELRDQVLDLYRKGIDPLLIAQRLGLTIGEIELIISLTRSRD